MQATKQHRSSTAKLALVGPWIANKGDDLMMRAARQHFSHVRLGAPPELWPAGVPTDTLFSISQRPSLRHFRETLGRGKFRQAARLIGKGVALSLPSEQAFRITKRMGAHHVTGLLDCSGFGYGDNWTTRRMHRRRDYYTLLRQRGAKIVLLPQALGPFRRPEMREAARQLIGLCDLAFARDADSFTFLRDLDLGDNVGIGQAPDISHLLEGRAPSEAGAWHRRVCVVPNARMMDRTSTARATAYMDFLKESVAEIRAANLEPWLVLHEANDTPLVDSLNAELDRPLPVIDEDALVTKGILGCCHAVIGSRYHALVSALSQATPTVGTSWSHKYEKLFEEYDHAAFLLPPEGAREERQRRIRMVLAENSRSGIAKQLAAAAARQRRRVEEMWRMVDEVLEIAPQS